MQIVQRLTTKETCVTQRVFLMECSCGYRFELDTLFGRRNCVLTKDARCPNSYHVRAECPECGDDGSSPLDLGITC